MIGYFQKCFSSEDVHFQKGFHVALKKKTLGSDQSGVGVIFSPPCGKSKNSNKFRGGEGMIKG